METRSDAGETSFVVHTRRDGARSIITCVGEIDLTTCDELYAAVLIGITDPRTTAVEIDFTGVTFMSAGGVQVLVRLLFTTQKHGKTFELTGMSPPVRRILELVGFDQLMWTWPV